MNEKKFKIYIDFDGTITTEDVGEKMFLTFGKPDEANRIIQLWLDDKISSGQSWEMLCNTVGKLEQKEFDDFISGVKIDSTFKEFIEFTEQNNLDVFVLSDGMDLYIDKILKQENLQNLKVFSNKLFIDDFWKITPQFPYTDEECHKCANCKRNHIISTSSDNDITIYIGDGFSDICPAQYCDFVFAKNSLLKFCEKNRISFYPYSTFADVKERISFLLTKNRVKKRYQAELKRKAVYLQG